MGTNTRNDVADAVRAAMARRRVSQHDLATTLGLSQTAISRRVSGRVDFNASELVTIAARLDVTVDSLFSFVSDAA
jgi:transcriptional regulator with XRE-family HTH domain